MEDDYVCEYDSTWDTESDGEEQTVGRPARRQDKNKPWALPWPHTSRNMRAAKDMQNYRRGYPNLTDDECSEDKMNNLKFYLNQFPSAPDDVFIETFHKEWKTDYKKLERVHSYIQWLFPLREPGVNYMASELTKKEIEAFKKSDEAKGRLVESYELMLGFYGIQLVNRETGEVKRADNSKERFGNLERNMHNNLRITRILKSLGELGFDHYQAPLVRFFLEETLVKKSLGSIKRSVLDYFLFAVLDKQKRQELVRFAYQNFEPKDKFVWCPRKILKQFKRAEKKPDAVGNGDGKEDHSSRGKGKDGEAAGGAQKEEAAAAARADGAADTQKSDQTTSGDKTKPSGAESKPEAGTLENGNAKLLLVDNNGCDAAEYENADDDEDDDGDDDDNDDDDDDDDDDDEMDQSVSPDPVRTNVVPDTSSSKDITPETVNVIEPERKTMDEEEDGKVLQSSTPAVDSANGQMEEKSSVTNALPMHTSPSAGPKTKPEGSSKSSPSRPSGREEKIPRTDFGTEEDKKAAEVSSESLLSVNKHTDEQTNGKGCEAMDVESNQPTSGQDGNS